MIPPFDHNGNLPPGIHPATLVEIEKRFSNNGNRKLFFDKLKLVVTILKDSNCPEIYLNGSYITSCEEPNDYDLCWEPTGVKPTDRLRELLQQKQKRKQKYLGDIFPRLTQPPYHFDHVERWQFDEEGNAKGIIKIILRNQL